MKDTKTPKIEVINYGITKNYLKHWGLQEALREIFQNFMDYGEYELKCLSETPKEAVIEISNDWLPENLTFLGIGNSIKSNNSARGKYGEGLKMAMLVFAREGLTINVISHSTVVKPFFQNTTIGETLAVKLIPKEEDKNFVVRFRIEKQEFDNFYNNIIDRDKDVIFDDNYYGRIVRKDAGKIYCGGLYVTKVDNLSKAYDINPSHLSLDRDRSVPKEFDVNWATSKINEKFGIRNAKDYSFSDTKYIDTISDEVKKTIKPKLVGNNIVATYKDEETGEDKVIENSRVQDLVKRDSFFSKTIKKLRNFIIDKMGVYQMLVEFRDKYLFGEQKEEFNEILKRLKNG